MDATPEPVYVTPAKKIGDEWIFKTPKRAYGSYTVTKDKYFGYTVRCDVTDKFVFQGPKTLSATREALSFVLGAIDYLVALGGERDGFDVTIETPLSPLTVRVQNDGVYCRFENAKLASSVLGTYRVNKYSGKYNLHFFEGLEGGTENRLESLASHVGAALESEPPVAPADKPAPNPGAVPDTFVSQLTKAELKALIDNACTDEARPLLCGVFFYYGAAVVSDGYTAFGYANCDMAEWGKSKHLEPAGAVGYTRDSLAGVLKLAKRNSRIEIDTAADRATVFHQLKDGTEAEGPSAPLKRSSSKPRPLNGVFPARANSMGESNRAQVVGMNAHLLSRVFGSFKTFAKAHVGVEITWPEDNLSPMRADYFDVDANRLWTAVVMPVRI
jgi:hypothetical protein